MRQAREILRDYRERHRLTMPGPTPEGLREENLRRLLRHVGAAHQTSESFEARLLPAMLRAREEAAPPRRRWPRGAARWPGLSRPAWQLWAPAAALATGAWVFASLIAPGHRAQLAPYPPAAPHPSHLPSAPPAASTPQPLIGYVLVGELRRQPAGEQRWLPVGSGAEVHLNDTLSTDANTQARVVFLDDSVCTVLPDSTLRYTAAARLGLQRPSRLILTRGATWNSVEKGGPLFMVQTPSATAVVRGTEFGVAVDRKGKTTLRVTEGKVELRAARATVLVSAGMQTVALPGHAPQLPVLMTAAARPASKAKPQPGTLPVASPQTGSARGAGTHDSGSSFHRSPASKPAPSPDEPLPGLPTDSSRSSAASRSGHETDAPPMSTGSW